MAATVSRLYMIIFIHDAAPPAQVLFLRPYLTPSVGAHEYGKDGGRIPVSVTIPVSGNIGRASVTATVGFPRLRSMLFLLLIEQ